MGEGRRMCPKEHQNTLLTLWNSILNKLHENTGTLIRAFAKLSRIFFLFIYFFFFWEVGEFSNIFGKNWSESLLVLRL